MFMYVQVCVCVCVCVWERESVCVCVCVCVGGGGGGNGKWKLKNDIIAHTTAIMQTAGNKARCILNSTAFSTYFRIYEWEWPFQSWMNKETGEKSYILEKQSILIVIEWFEDGSVCSSVVKVQAGNQFTQHQQCNYANTNSAFYIHQYEMWLMVSFCVNGFWKQNVHWRDVCCPSIAYLSSYSWLWP